MESRIKLERISGSEAFWNIRQIASKEAVMLNFCGYVYDEDDINTFFDSIIQFNSKSTIAGGFNVVSTLNDRFIGLGFLWVSPYESRVECIVLPEFWNLGYGTEIICELTKLAKQIPNLEMLYSFPRTDNIAARRMLEKSGFVFRKEVEVEETDAVLAVYNLKLKRS